MVHRLIPTTSAQAPGPSGPGAGRHDVFVLGGAPNARGRLRRIARRAAAVVAAAVVVGMGLGLVVGPRVAGYRVLYVRTASMEPTLPVGALLVVRQVHADQVRNGDILTFSHPDDPRRLVTHRVVGRDADSFATKGDANAAVDPWRVPAHGSGWRSAFSVPGLGFVLGYLRSGAVSGFALAGGIVLAACHGLRLIWRPRPAVA